MEAMFLWWLCGGGGGGDVVVDWALVVIVFVLRWLCSGVAVSDCVAVVVTVGWWCENWRWCGGNVFFVC